MEKKINFIKELKKDFEKIEDFNFDSYNEFIEKIDKGIKKVFGDISEYRKDLKRLKAVIFFINDDYDEKFRDNNFNKDIENKKNKVLDLLSEMIEHLELQDTEILNKNQVNIQNNHGNVALENNGNQIITKDKHNYIIGGIVAFIAGTFVLIFWEYIKDFIV